VKNFKVTILILAHVLLHYKYNVYIHKNITWRRIIKRYCKFSDGSIALIDINRFYFQFKPEYVYSSNMLGFGEWISINQWIRTGCQDCLTIKGSK